MKPLLWLCGAVILAVAAFAVWYAFQRPDFVAALTAAAAGAAWKAVAPQIGKRKAPEEEAQWRRDQVSGVQRDWKGRERQGGK